MDNGALLYKGGMCVYTFICYGKCSTCQKARRHLEELNVPFVVREIKEENPTVEELKEWCAMSGLPLRKFFNTSGIKYRELELSKKMDSLSDEEKLVLLASDGMLVKRPLLVSEDTVIVGYRSDVYNSLK